MPDEIETEPSLRVLVCLEEIPVPVIDLKARDSCLENMQTRIVGVIEKLSAESKVDFTEENIGSADHRGYDIIICVEWFMGGCVTFKKGIVTALGSTPPMVSHFFTAITNCIEIHNRLKESNASK